MKMNNVFLLRLLFSLFFICSMSEALAQSPSKQINEIKRNEAYLFEEATAATEKEAREMAVVKLAKIISDYIKEKNPEETKQFDDFKDLAEGAEEIVTERGSQKRVFLYFNKVDIDAMADGASQIEILPTELEPEQENVPKFAVEDNTPRVTAKPDIERHETAGQTTSNSTPVVHSSNFVSDNSLAEWQKRLVGNFLKKNLTLLAAKDLVNTYRIENKIKRHGSKSNPPAQSGQAFYVFSDETGNIVAVLGRDKGGQRLNYCNGNYESISNYSSYNYIWFTLNN